MSRVADINEVFQTLIKACPEQKGHILKAQFDLFEALDWDENMADVVNYMLENGFDEDISNYMLAFFEEHNETNLD